MRSCNTSADGCYITSIYDICYCASCWQDAQKMWWTPQWDDYMKTRRKQENVRSRDNDNRKQNCDYYRTDHYPQTYWLGSHCDVMLQWMYMLTIPAPVYLKKWKILRDDSQVQNHIFTLAVAQLHYSSIADTRVIVQGTTLDSAMVTGLATNREDAFLAFLWFYVVDFLASISGTEIPQCTTPWRAGLPLRNMS